MNKHIKIILDRIGNDPCIFDFLQKVCNLGDLRKQVSSSLRALPEESILDVGCGTGLYSILAKNKYVGIDLNEAYIKYAQIKYKDKNKKFIVGDVTKIDFGDELFDKTLYLAMLHHFNEEDNIRILTKISAITRGKILILDLTIPERVNFIQSFFLKVERGRYVRSLSQQLRIIGKVLKIQDATTILNRSKFGLFSIIDAQPKDIKL